MLTELAACLGAIKRLFQSLVVAESGGVVFASSIVLPS